MVNSAVVGLGFAAIAVMAASVLGTVGGRERFLFVAGVTLVLAGLSLVRGSIGGFIALLGFVAVAVSTVPLLRESPEA